MASVLVFFGLGTSVKNAGNTFHVKSGTVKPGTEADNNPVTVQTSGFTGAGEQNCKLAIIPVKVKSKKGQRTFGGHAECG